MNLFKNIGNMTSQAKSVITKKAQKTALTNKLYETIKLEKIKSDRAYVALGKYYYNNMRDNFDVNTSETCFAIDECDKKIEEAKAHLKKLSEEVE